ncbi:MAG: molybdate ABC transporter permease subunit [Desulfovibrio sp.]|nr:MAG: molybdate ABC transporter permease subunit [Desulfovibrio sp.]
MDWTSLAVTGKLALVVTPLLVALALPLAWLLAFTRFPGKPFLEALCNLPLVLPPTVLGFGLLLAMSPRSSLGQAWKSLFGSNLVFSFSGLVLASMVYSLPFALQPLRAAFVKLDKSLLESASVMGLSRLATFFRVVLPNSLAGLTGAGVLVFAHTAGEFGVALMVGGSVDGSTKVASIAIFEHVETLRYDAALTMSLVLAGASYAVLLLMGRINRA